MRVRPLSGLLAAALVGAMSAAGSTATVAAERPTAQSAVQNSPERPIRLIDPYAPGGGSGLIALRRNLLERYAPARTPRPIIDKVHAEVVKVLNTPDVRAHLAP